MTETKEFARVQREDGLWNYAKPDGTFLCTIIKTINLSVEEN